MFHSFLKTFGTKSRTRPGARGTSDRRRVKLHLEGLEKRELLSTAVFANCYSLSDWRLNGLWRWQAGNWQQIDTNNPTQMASADHTEVFADYADGPMKGLWDWTLNAGSWSGKQLDTDVPFQIATAVKGEVFAAYSGVPGKGLVRFFNGTQTSLTSDSPVTIVSPSNNEVFASFSAMTPGLRLWNFNLGSQPKTISPAGLQSVTPSMIASGTYGDLFAYYTGNGLYHFLDDPSMGTWNHFGDAAPYLMIAPGKSTMFGAYNEPAVAGIWQWTSTVGWNQFDYLQPSAIASADTGEVFAAYSGQGLWRGTAYESWDRLSQTTPDYIASAEKGGVVAGISGQGLVMWSNNNTVGQQLTSLEPAQIVAVPYTTGAPDGGSSGQVWDPAELAPVAVVTDVSAAASADSNSLPGPISSQTLGGIAAPASTSETGKSPLLSQREDEFFMAAATRAQELTQPALNLFYNLDPTWEATI
jgi:hypothetical protein